MKSSNLKQGKEIVDIYGKVSRNEVITQEEYDRAHSLADEYEAIWTKQITEFDAQQNKFAERNGIKLVDQEKPVK